MRGDDHPATAPVIPKTSFGPGILGFIEEYYAGRCIDQAISFFDALYGFAVSQNAVWNARNTIRDLLEVTYKEILNHITEAPFVQLDESLIRMNGKQGYICWRPSGTSHTSWLPPVGRRPSWTSISGRSWASRLSRTGTSHATCCPSGRGAGCTHCARPKSTPSGTADPTYPITAGCSPCTGPSRAGSRPTSPSAPP